jgi:hypothetical protein
MFGSYQRFGCIVGSNIHQEHGHGHIHCKHTFKVPHAALDIVGYEAEGNVADGYDLHHYSCVWLR